MCFLRLQRYVFITRALPIVCGGAGKVEHVPATCVRLVCWCSLRSCVVVVGTCWYGLLPDVFIDDHEFRPAVFVEKGV